MAARRNDKAIGEKAVRMIKAGAKLREVAEATGLSMGSMSYYARKARGLTGDALNGRKPAKRGLPKKVRGSGDDDLARRIDANLARWTTIQKLLREME